LRQRSSNERDKIRDPQQKSEVQFSLAPRDVDPVMIFFRRIGHTFRVASVRFDGAHLGEDLI
jgi:hypothetical protein